MNLSEVKYLPKIDHTPAELDEASKLLLKAAALIAERGHCQNGRGHDAGGGVCVMVALSHCSRSGATMEEAEKRLRDHVKAIPTERICAVANWSDSTPTDVVLSTMRRVALGL